MRENILRKIREFFTNLKKRRGIFIGVLVFFALLGSGFFIFSQIDLKLNKKALVLFSLSTADKLSRFLPVEEDEKKELEVVNKLVEKFTQNDNQEKRFLILLQNNYELRPGGGFLGQYAVLKTKNGEVTSLFVEDANLLDQRITAKIPAPYPFQRMMGTKKWKFRDANFSPDFALNAEKVKYFFRLAGGNSNFDGVIAVNTDVFNDLLGLTGPLSVPGYPGIYTSEDGAWKLEEQVEKPYLFNETLDTQNRKNILKKMAPLIVEKLMKIKNIPKIAELFHQEMKNKNIMLNFSDPELQALVESVYWDGKVSQDWNSDYLMVVDANMGALKSDYYIRRELSYEVDLTGEKPTATLNILYRHTATHGDWRTSDYHTYLRVFVPQGSQLLEKEMVGAANSGEELGKSFFGFIAHTLINQETQARIKYELPERLKNEEYRLLVQKQSGIGNLPLKIKVKTAAGEFFQEAILKNDLKFEFSQN